MSGRRFDVADVAEVLVMWQAGHSARDIARVLQMGRDRIRAIVRRAQSHGHAVALEPLSRDEWRECVATMFSDRAYPAPTAQRQELEEFRAAIERGLETETASALWRRLHDDQGMDVALRTFRRYASELRGANPIEQGMRTALLVQLGAARERIRELEDELNARRGGAHLYGEALTDERMQASG